MTKETKDALLNSASMFIVPVRKVISDTTGSSPSIKGYRENGIGKFIDYYDIDFGRHYCFNIIEQSPYQIGENLTIDNKDKATIKSIKVVKVQDIDDDRTMDNINPDNWQYPSSANYLYDDYTNNIIEEIANKRFTTFIDWYNKQYGNYEDNPYVFLYEVER